MILLLFLTVVSALAFMSKSVAVVFFVCAFTCFIFIGGNVTIANRFQRTRCFTVFVFCLSVYLIHALLSSSSYFSLGEFYTNVDQVRFFGEPDGWAHLSYWESWKEIFIRQYARVKDLAGSYLLFTWIARTAELFFDGNSVWLQKCGIACVAALIPVGVFRILSFYIEGKTALRYALLYGVFSYILPYSSSILRDVHIALLYCIGIYWVHFPFSLRRVFSLVLLTLLIWTFRPESAVLFFGIVGIYVLYSKSRNASGGRVLVLIGSVMACVVMSPIIYSLFQDILFVAMGYSSFTSEAKADSGSFFAQFYMGLPIGIREVVAMLNGLFPVIPATGYALRLLNLPIREAILDFCLFSSYIFSAVMSFKVFSNFSLCINILKKNKILLFLTLYFFCFFFAQSFNFSARRVLAAYPIFFILFVLVSVVRKQREEVEI